MWNSGNIKLAFFIPFLLVGSIYSFFALTYLNTLPSQLHEPLDMIYAVFVSFIDMGTTGGVTGLILLSLASKLIPWISGERSKSEI